MPLILVVGSENQVRSPLCEALGNALAVKRQRPDLVFDSCGWSVDYPERLASGLREELARRKLDLDSFRTKRLEAALVEKAALVLCVDDKLSARFAQAYPLKAPLLLPLGNLAQLKGVGPDDYKACADQVQSALEKAWPAILSALDRT